MNEMNRDKVVLVDGLGKVRNKDVKLVQRVRGIEGGMHLVVVYASGAYRSVPDDPGRCRSFGQLGLEVQDEVILSSNSDRIRDFPTGMNPSGIVKALDADGDEMAVVISGHPVLKVTISRFPAKLHYNWTEVDMLTRKTLEASRDEPISAQESATQTNALKVKPRV